ncbi:DNA-directed RNA polymerase subunit beta [Hutsoniella sourekii]|uniref:DNA-directed RNA polymerase subunit beta n=1 Tax=Hutsoniella sourekii TaxID=87650 RepID=UPI0004B9D2B2|nr:DNA-directed RNA polymerase subunit beta [Hutsoniella sourekii]
MNHNGLSYSSFNETLKLLGKILIFILILVIFFIIGLFIGYCLIGDGKYWEVLNQDTWQHIVNFIE